MARKKKEVPAASPAPAPLIVQDAPERVEIAGVSVCPSEALIEGKRLKRCVKPVGHPLPHTSDQGQNWH